MLHWVSFQKTKEAFQKTKEAFQKTKEAFQKTKEALNMQIKKFTFGLMAMIALLVCASTHLSAASSHCKKQETGCGSCHTITRKAFCKHGSLRTSITINKPGNYCLGEDIAYTPRHEGTAAITIDASDVYLDLCGFNLSQGNGVISTIGILVKNGHENINVFNGVIKDFTQLGISVESVRYLQLGNEDTTLRVTGCGGGTSLAQFANGQAQFQGGIQLGSTNFYAGQNFPVPVGEIEFLNMINVQADSNYTAGIILGLGHDYLFTDCTCNNNFETRQTGGFGMFGNALGNGLSQIQAYGLFFVTDPRIDPVVPNWSLTRCSFNNNSVTVPDDIFFDGSIAIGAEQTGTFENALFDACSFNQNNSSAGANNIGISYAKGYDLGGGKNLRFLKCEFNDNFGGESGGFHMSGTITDPQGGPEAYYLGAEDVLVQDCVAYRNIGASIADDPNADFVRSAGFESVGGKNHVYKNCHAAGNQGVSVVTQGRVFGLRLRNGFELPTQTLENVIIDGCTFENQSVESPEPSSFSAGIYVQNIDDVNFTRDVTIKNSTITSNIASEGTLGSWGIIITGGGGVQRNLVIKNNEIIENDIGIGLTNDKESIAEENTISHAGIGIFLDNTDCDWVRNNIIGYVDIGIQDTAAVSTSLVASNEVFNANTGYMVNYAFGPVPVTSNDLTVGFPPLPTVSLENYEVIGLCAPVLARSKKAFNVKALRHVTKKQKVGGRCG